MSVYLHVPTNKWFDTLSEYRAWERQYSDAIVKHNIESRAGVKNPAPSSTSVKTEEVKPEVKPEKSVEPEIKVSEPEKDEVFTIPDLTRNEMVKILKDAGVDGRTVGSKVTDEEIIKMYISFLENQ